MIHAWLVTQRGLFRVWDSALQRWIEMESWQAFSDTLNASLSSRVKDNDVCLYIPTNMALTLTNELKAAQLKQLGVTGQQYLFEELALSPVEQLRVRHMAQGVHQYFYALSTSDIEQWQQSAQLAGLNVKALLPDFTLLPSPETLLNNNADVQANREAVVYQDSQTLLLRYTHSHGAAISYPALLPKLLSNIEEVVYLTAGHSLQNTESSGTDDSLVSMQKLSMQKLTIQQLCDEHGIVLTSSNQSLKPVNTPVKHALNFVEIKRTRLASPYLTLAASVLLLAGVVQIAADALQFYQYKQVVTTTKASVEQQFASWFKGERLNPRVNVKMQVQPRLLTGQTTQQIQLNTLNRVSPILKQSNLIAQSLKWSDTNIAIVVIADRRENIDKMQSALTAQGITANLGAINPTQDGGVRGELNIPLASATDTTNQNTNAPS